MIWGVVYKTFFSGEDNKFLNYQEILPSTATCEGILIFYGGMSVMVQGQKWD